MTYIPTEPSDGDFIFQDSGPLGSKTSVGVFEGKFIGEFNSYEEAEKAVKEYKKKHHFFPDSWFCSDHGNLNLIIP